MENPAPDEDEHCYLVDDCTRGGNVVTAETAIRLEWYWDRTRGSTRSHNWAWLCSWQCVVQYARIHRENTDWRLPRRATLTDE